MSYVKRLRTRFRSATKEYVPAMRVLGTLTELELADREHVKRHLNQFGLPEMSGIIHAMTDSDYSLFVQEIEDTSEEEEFH